MRRTSVRNCAVLSALACLVAAAPAAAQSQCDAAKAGEPCYTFDDDLLNSDVVGSDAPPLIGRTVRGRTYLLRPRTSFVVELYKSVEHI